MHKGRVRKMFYRIAAKDDFGTLDYLGLHGKELCFYTSTTYAFEFDSEEEAKTVIRFLYIVDLFPESLIEVVKA